MKKRSILLPALLVALASDATAQASRDAVAIDPANHNVVLENEHVRVFRALASPGARSPMHTHPPFVFVSLGTTRLRLRTPQAANVIFDVTPGQVLWLENAEHSWELLAGQLHVVAVEVKAAARRTPPPPITLPPTDAVAVDPDGHQVVLENPYVRVIEGLSGAGRRSPMHTHSRGGTIISFGRARLKLTLADGSSPIADLHPGQVIWLDPQSHAWEIVSGASNVVVVEVKSATGGTR